MAFFVVTACTADDAPDAQVQGAAPQAVAATSPSTDALPEPSPATALTPEVKAACRHAMVAVVAQDGPSRLPSVPHDWKAAEAEMYAAWRVGHMASDPAFVDKLLPPGSLTPGDTQTLGESIDTLALACGIPLYYE